MNFGEILEKSFKYPWKNKALWFYGTLIAVFSGGSGIVNSFDSSDFTEFSRRTNIDFSNVNLLVAGSIALILVLFFSIIGIVVVSWAQAALMRGVALLEKGKNISRKEIGQTGRRPVWKLILLNVFLPILIFLALVLLLAPFVALLVYLYQFDPQKVIGIGLILALLFLFALIPALVYFGIVWGLASRVVVLEELNVKPSLRQGMKLVKGQFWQTLLFSILLGLIAGMANLFLLLPFVAIILTVIAFVAAKITAGIVAGVVIAILYLAFYLIALGYLQSFSQTGWTLWYFSLQGKKAK